MSSQPLPRVTDILAEAGLVSAEWFTDRARDRGTAVHLATQLLDEGRLDFDSLDPEVAPRLQQYQRFLAETDVLIQQIELEVTHPVHRYVGHLDRIALLGGRRVVIDIKGPAEEPWHGLQLAAYQEAAQPRPVGRYNLYLSDDHYRLVPRTDRDDWPVFLAALQVAQFKRRNK